MLAMNTLRRPWRTLIGMLLCGLPAVVSAEGLHRSASQADEKVVQSQSRQSVGAPQVLEIPPVQAATPSPVTAPAADERSANMGVSQTEALPPDPEQSMAAARRSYLGLLYVSRDNEEDGVVVVDIIAGSPAARAGFIGERTEVPSTRTEQVMKVAIVGLTVSGVGAFAVMPLILAHEMFLSCRQRGDIIVAIGDRLVRNVQDFNDEMRRHQPGEQVTFSVKRCGKPTQIAVQLEEEPADSLSGDESEVRDRLPSSYQQPNSVGVSLPGTSFLP